MRPPCASTRPRAIARPRPLPPPLERAESPRQKWSNMRQRARIDARELEEVVDEPAQGAHLVAERGEVLVRRREAVLERLEHRLHRRERRPQVVARPRDELAARVEQLLELARHLVERAR